jgi:hypothetical protein
MNAPLANVVEGAMFQVMGSFMRRGLCGLPLALGAMLLGCGSGWTPLLDTPRTPTRAAAVELLVYPISRPYHEVGVLRVGFARPFKELTAAERERLKEEGARRGCDGLVEFHHDRRFGSDYDEGEGFYGCIAWGQATPREAALEPGLRKRAGVPDPLPDEPTSPSEKELMAALKQMDLTDCKAAGARGKGGVNVVIAPDGSVASAKISSGPIVDGPHAECILGHYRAIRVKPPTKSSLKGTGRFDL